MSKLPLYINISCLLLCSNKNRATIIIYYYVSIISGIDVDCCSTHPAITEIEKNIFRVNLALVNLVIDWRTYNLSHHDWARIFSLPENIISFDKDFTLLLRNVKLCRKKTFLTKCERDNLKHSKLYFSSWRKILC